MEQGGIRAKGLQLRNQLSSFLLQFLHLECQLFKLA